VPPAQIVFVQTPLPAEEVPEPSKPESLLIEWQGDRYVRSSGTDDASVHARRTRPDYAQESNPDVPGGKATIPARDLPSVLLIFRDSRKEEVSSYAIADGVMYVNSDYWSSGSWNRKVQLADLDLPATLKTNQQRNVKFVLPAGPNQVVTRP
ncbi:MAG: hypothetical protein ACREMY_30865, partial [bacterium]